MEDQDHTIQKFDRVYAGLQGVALLTKPSTVKDVQFITGRSETYVVQTARHAELGDTIFVEVMDENGVTRLALPPKVASLIASQRDSLTARRRSIASRATARQRMERGEAPAFTRKKTS